MKFNLAIDIGNSRTKAGLFSEKSLIHLFQIPSSDVGENLILLNDYEIQSGIVSSVNEAVESSIVSNINQFPLLHLSHDLPLPIELAYETVETLGKDRIASVVGAWAQFPATSILVIDAGTCVTYDILTFKGQYLGGAISPGVQMRLKSMNNFTDKLPLVNWGQEEKPRLTGRSTITSMLSGVINGLLSEMKGLIHDYSQTYPKLKVILTGGDSNFFAKELKNGIFADPNLVLKGLNEILVYNCK